MEGEAQKRKKRQRGKDGEEKQSKVFDCFSVCGKF